MFFAVFILVYFPYDRIFGKMETSVSLEASFCLSQRDMLVLSFWVEMAPLNGKKFLATF
jgi:hypothetical protein